MAKNLLIQESVDFITNNINVTTLEIPSYLLENWYVSEDVTDYLTNGEYISTFFIFLYAFDTYNKTLGKKVQLSSLESMAMFGQFQILIALTLGKETEVTCNPINLFDFDNYSKLNITVS